MDITAIIQSWLLYFAFRWSAWCYWISNSI